MNIKQFIAMVIIITAFGVSKNYIPIDYHFLYGVVCMCIVNIVMCLLKNRKIRFK